MLDELSSLARLNTLVLLKMHRYNSIYELRWYRGYYSSLKHLCFRDFLFNKLPIGGL